MSREQTLLEKLKHVDSIAKLKVIAEKLIQQISRDYEAEVDERRVEEAEVLDKLKNLKML